MFCYVHNTMKFAFSVTFSAQCCRNPCPYKASWPSCAASDCTYQAIAELEYGADVTAPALTGPSPGRYGQYTPYMETSEARRMNFQMLFAILF